MIFFSLGLAEINMIFKVWLESNYVQYFSLVTPDQRNVNCLSTQIPFIARAHRYTPGGLCFPQVIYLHTPDPQLDGEILEIKDLVIITQSSLLQVMEFH